MSAAKPKNKSKTKGKVLASLPEKLTVRRAISPSHAVFFSKGKDDILTPLTLNTITGVGTFASYEHQFDDKKVRDDRTMASSNPYRSDVAHLPHDSDTLVVKMSLTIDKAVGNYECCDDPVFAEKLTSITSAFFKSVAGKELAKLYVDNLLTGTWLFRNRRSLSKTINIKVMGTSVEDGVIDRPYMWEVQNKGNFFTSPRYHHLIDFVRQAFADEMDSRLVLECTMSLKHGDGARLYPSELWVDNDGLAAKDTKKHLFVACKKLNATGLTDVKVGNGLRTVDKWHGEEGIVIPTSPYGQYREGHRILRSRAKGNDFYTLLAKTVDNAEQTLETIRSSTHPDDVPGDVYFVISNLIKGGVFNATSKEEKTEVTKDQGDE
jgi:CRISPR-associated protein Csy3